MNRRFAFRVRTLFALVAAVVAGCGRRNFLTEQFGFPTSNTLLGVMLLGIVAAFAGWIYYRATR